MSNIFTPKADDKNIAPREVGTEYAIVKSSGYIDRPVVGPRGLFNAARYAANHGGRVIVSRLIGTEAWYIVDADTLAAAVFPSGDEEDDEMDEDLNDDGVTEV
jgi:hypothetical protein